MSSTIGTFLLTLVGFILLLEAIISSEGNPHPISYIASRWENGRVIYNADEVAQLLAWLNLGHDATIDWHMGWAWYESLADGGGETATRHRLYACALGALITLDPANVEGDRGMLPLEGKFFEISWALIAPHPHHLDRSPEAVVKMMLAVLELCRGNPHLAGLLVKVNLELESGAGIAIGRLLTEQHGFQMFRITKERIQQLAKPFYPLTSSRFP